MSSRRNAPRANQPYALEIDAFNYRNVKTQGRFAESETLGCKQDSSATLLAKVNRRARRVSFGAHLSEAVTSSVEVKLRGLFQSERFI